MPSIYPSHVSIYIPAPWILWVNGGVPKWMEKNMENPIKIIKIDENWEYFHFRKAPNTMKPFGVEDWPSWDTQCSDRCIPTCGIWDPKITDLNTRLTIFLDAFKKLNGPYKSIQFYDICVDHLKDLKSPH